MLEVLTEMDRRDVMVDVRAMHAVISAVAALGHGEAAKALSNAVSVEHKRGAAAGGWRGGVVRGMIERALAQQSRRGEGEGAEASMGGRRRAKRLGSAAAADGDVGVGSELAGGGQMHELADVVEEDMQVHGRDGPALEGSDGDEFLLRMLLREISRHGQRGEVEAARNVFDKGLSRHGVHAYTAMIRVYFLNGHDAEAEDLFVEMREAGVALNAAAYATMIDGLAAAGRTLPAMRLFWEARLEGILPFASYVSHQRDGTLLVDLHGMSALTSVVGVELALGLNQTGQRVELVTGKGLHSKHGVPRVRPAVETFLSEHGIRFLPAVGNEGRLVVARIRSQLPLLVFCCLLLGIMWLLGAILAAQWLDMLRERTMAAARARELERLREELRRGLLEHAKGRRAQGPTLNALILDLERDEAREEGGGGSG